MTERQALTKESLEQMVFRDHLNYREIAERTGYSKARVWQVAQKHGIVQTAGWSRDRIWRLRRKLGLSQAAFARKLVEGTDHVPPTQDTVSRWDLGFNRPSHFFKRQIEKLEREAGL